MRIVLVALTLLLAGPAMAQTTTPGQVLQATVSQAIRPGVLEFTSRASGLSIAMNALCRAPSEGTLALVKGQFRQAALAYGRVEFLRIGPLMADNRADRLLFWPDRRGIGLRQVQAILAEEDASATALDTLRAKSVAVQGFGALEFVLYGTGAEVLPGPEGEFRCAYGRAVAANIAGIAGELANGWFAPEGIADHLTAPRADYADYRTETEALEALVGLVSHGMEAVRDVRINPFLPTAERAARPKEALFWRSGLSFEMIGANVDGMQRLLDQSGIAGAVDADHSGLGNSIDFEFRNAARALALVTSPVEQALADEDQVKALNYLVIVTGSLQAMVGEQLSAALGLSVGFSSLDGD
ncbi:imelysin family protein [Devosia ginsengisoli]|uniref:Peptidase M75, Imelysin n=1 Tax=Devosia ginsengisoli TaxID=400770 RepID=A0A5B8LS81_9HYPH|nr:imelysin family protein [Devosia ginsengisoli]QDZ11177.1 peptidase M75, Imelysin [Devosia ginsengisoli]